MQQSQLDWRKNVKPIKCGKVTLRVDHKVNIKSVVNKDTSCLQEKFFNVNKGNLPFCIDYNTKSKVDKGKYLINDKLDLHGYNIEDAYYKLIDFIVKNYQEGSRCLLIITGHGNTKDETDTIRSSLNKWLNDTSKIQHMVLYCQQATKKHGGEGAFYVLLRRNRDFRP